MGRPVSIYMRVLAKGYEEVHTHEYEVELFDVNGSVVKVWAVGLDTLTQEAPFGDLACAYNQFPDIPRKDLERPEGPIDLLMGQDHAGFLPKVSRSQGHLLLLESRFGSGRLLTGRTGKEGVSVCDHVLTLQAQEYSRASRIIPSYAVLVNHVSSALPSFFEAEDMNSPLPPTCKQHRDDVDNCRECSYRGDNVSRNERKALEYMEDSLERGEDGRLRISYPFNEKAWLQKDNRHQARAVQLRVEENLRKKGVLGEYHEEMEKAIQAGSLRLIGDQEQYEWTGPVLYITHFGVLNNESKSTRVRIVSNSAMRNQHTQLSFNDTTEDVPNALNDLLDVLIQWRGHQQTVMYDLSKAYQSLRTGDLELHLRRVLYRREGEEDFSTYGYTCVTFGDDPAAAALELGKRKAALDAMEVDSLAAARTWTMRGEGVPRRRWSA